MSNRAKLKLETVARCVPRQDGGHLILTLRGQSAVSTQPIPEGARIVIRDGQAVRTP